MSGRNGGRAGSARTPPFVFWEDDMALYVILANFTDQGVKAIKDKPKRAEAFKAMAAKSGVKVHSLYWTLGQHDVVSIAEADDDIAATALSLSIASLGNVRTQTLRAFDAADMAKVIAKMA
jgi:uncharacterized protein with GYD domain